MWGQVLENEKLPKRISGPRNISGPGLAQAMVAHIYGITMEELCASTRRGARAALARQVTMYLIHVVHGLSLSEVGATFGRDRSTASHACHLVEDMRDDAAFDRQLAALENMLRAASYLEEAA